MFLARITTTLDRRRVIDEPCIVRNGYIPYSFQAIGVTNLTEALRQAAYILYTNRDENIFATYSQPRLGHLVNLYDTFYLACKNNGWGTAHVLLDMIKAQELSHYGTLSWNCLVLKDIQSRITNLQV